MALNVAIDQVAMRKHFPGFSFRFEKTKGIWKGTLQPRPGSPVYTISIKFQPRTPPEVRVLSPKIAKGAPHVFSCGCLCLYWGKDFSWNSSMLLAEKIVPWTALWLLYYEIWLDTGVWKGPESPHQYPGRRRRND